MPRYGEPKRGGRRAGGLSVFFSLWKGWKKKHFLVMGFFFYHQACAGVCSSCFQSSSLHGARVCASDLASPCGYYCCSCSCSFRLNPSCCGCHRLTWGLKCYRSRPSRFRWVCISFSCVGEGEEGKKKKEIGERKILGFFYGKEKKKNCRGSRRICELLVFHNIIHH